MIFDKQNLFSDGQAITTAGATASTNVIDLGPVGTPISGTKPLPRDLGAGMPIPIRIQVVEKFVGLINLNVAFQVSNNSGFLTTGTTGGVANTVKTVFKSADIPLAQLTVGTVIGPYYIPEGTDQRYIRLRYNTSGTATAGKVTAGIVTARPTNG